MDIDVSRGSIDSHAMSVKQREFNKEAQNIREGIKGESVGKKLNEIVGGEAKDSLKKDKVNNQQLGKDEFLKLLMAQIKNQDPLKPMDGREMTSQMAQLSSLEQLVNMNTKMDDLKRQNMENLMDGSQLIGRHVDARSNMLLMKGGKETTLPFTLPQQATTVDIKIYDDAGKLIRTMKHGNIPAGLQKMNWDGKDKDGKAVVDGEYTFSVLAVDSQGKQMLVRPDMSGTVTGVAIERGKTVLKIGDTTVRLEDVQSVKALETASTPQAPTADTPEKTGAPSNKDSKAKGGDNSGS